MTLLFSRLINIYFPALLAEFVRFLRHALERHIADFLGDLHRAEFRPAHRTEIRVLGARRRQRLVMERSRRFRVERQVKLVLPAEFKARTRKSIVADTRRRM